MFKIKKINLLAIKFIVLFLLIFCSNFIPAANADIYSGIPRTIAHDFLDMEKPFGAVLRHDEYINKLINKATLKIKFKNDYTTEEAIIVMSSIYILLKEEGFIFKPNFLLNVCLDKKQIDCDNYCAIYTAISEVLRLPIIPVFAPNHSFLRFNFNDGTYLNWEPVEGRHYPDAYYVKKLKIADQSIHQGVYLKSLSRKEFLGVQNNNIGAYLFTNKKFREAIPYFSEAIKLYPFFSSAYHNRGSSYYALNRKDRAFEDIRYTVTLDPMRPDTHNTLGDIYFDRKEYLKAFDHYAESIKLDPDNFAPYYGLGMVMKNAGKNKEADEWFRKSEEVKMKNRVRN
ncbi:MAG: tetratricopeptide repeat protein [Spirochaetes bacterium]|nr:tetratricopeptide repeat protein [Spirochaetota bacterium]